MVFTTTFNNISAISWRLIVLGRKQEYFEETTDLPQVTDEVFDIMLYRLHPAVSG
jgi:hypothetical protein